MFNHPGFNHPRFNEPGFSDPGTGFDTCKVEKGGMGGGGNATAIFFVCLLFTRGDGGRETDARGLRGNGKAWFSAFRWER